MFVTCLLALDWQGLLTCAAVEYAGFQIPREDFLRFTVVSQALFFNSGLGLTFTALVTAAQMLELAKKGARWLREYEGWGSGANAPVVQEGKELPEMLRHLLHPKGNDTRDVSDGRPSMYFCVIFSAF